MKKCFSSILLRGCLVGLATSAIFAMAQTAQSASVSLLTDRRSVAITGDIRGPGGDRRFSQDKTTTTFAPVDATASLSEDSPAGSTASASASQVSTAAPDHLTATGHLEAAVFSGDPSESPSATATASLEITFQVLQPVFFTFSGLLTHVANEGGSADGSVRLDSPDLGVLVATNSTGGSGSAFDFSFSGQLPPGTYTLHASQNLSLDQHSLQADYRWDLQLGGNIPPLATVTFSNLNAIQISGPGAATPYPSTITAANVEGVIGHDQGEGNPGSNYVIGVQLNDLTHPSPQDLGFLLVGPDGQNTILLAGVGGTDPAQHVTLELSAATAGVGQVSPDGPLVSGTFLPSGDSNFPFVAPAPQAPYGKSLADFAGGPPNGTWSLYVYDKGVANQGVLAGGWSLTIHTLPNTPPLLTWVAPGGFQSPKFPDILIAKNTPIPPIPYAVFDFEQPAARLVVSAHSANQSLLPDSSLLLSGQTLTLTPVADQSGTATITLTASDGLLETNASFTLTVSATEHPPGTFANSTPITIPDHGAGDPYPSTIQVGGLDGVIRSLTVELDGLSHTWPQDLGFLLVGPDGQKSLLMVHSGGGHPVNNISLILDDSASNPLPEWDQLVSGRYRPIPYRENFPFPAPAPPGPYQADLKLFRGHVPNGIWALYVLDNAVADHGILAGGWSLTINTTPNTSPTLSYILPDGEQTALPDQSTLANVTVGPIPLLVTDGEQNTNQLTFSAHSSNPTLIPDSNIVFRGGTAGYDVTGAAMLLRDVMLIPAPDQTGSATITLTVSDGLAQTSISFNLDVIAPAYQAQTFVNPGSIVIPDQGTATPYPSTIQVSGLAGAVTRVTLRLYEFTHTATHDLRVLLVSPAGERAILMDHVSQYSYGIFNGIIGFDDLAAPIPALLPDAFYHPTIGFLQTLPVSNAPLPDSAPAPPYPAELGVFRAIPPNGAWSLYVVDDAAQDHGVIAGGWDLTIETSPGPTPVLSSIPDQTLPMNTVSPPLPFTVEDALTPADKLFLSATSSNPALIPDANILLSGSGTHRTVIVTPLTGQTGSAEIRISATNLTRVGASVSFVVNVTSQGAFMTFANPAAIAIPDQGPASPYPSTINVSGLSGVINDVTVTLYDLSHTWPHDVGVLLVSPGGSASLLMADAGGGNPVQAVALEFDDAAASSLTQGPLLAGTYRPTSFDSHDPFPSPASAEPYPATLSVFNGLSPNGTWSLYVLDDAAQDHGQIADGWSLTLSTAPGAGLMSLRVNPDPTDPLISVNRAARFESMAVLPNGHFSATIRSSARQGYVLQASPDGIVWLDLLTNAAATDSFSFSDAHALDYDHRFYRLRMLEAAPPGVAR